MHVLVTSQSRDDLRRMREILDGTGWVVSWARTAQDAVKMNIERGFDVVLSDSGLSDTTWQNLLNALNELSRPPLMVVISSLPDRQLWAEAINLGVHDVLAKPLCTEEVRWVFGGIESGSRGSKGDQRNVAECEVANDTKERGRS